MTFAGSEVARVMVVRVRGRRGIDKTFRLETHSLSI
jgi:hypothetical protein